MSSTRRRRAPNTPVIVVHQELVPGVGITACAGELMPEAVPEEHADVPRVKCTGCAEVMKPPAPRSGPRSNVPLGIVARIVHEHDVQMHSTYTIADGLNAEYVPTAHGAHMWKAATVRSLLGSSAADEARKLLHATRRGRLVDQ